MPDLPTRARKDPPSRDRRVHPRFPPNALRQSAPPERPSACRPTLRRAVVDPHHHRPPLHPGARARLVVAPVSRGSRAAGAPASSRRSARTRHPRRQPVVDRRRGVRSSLPTRGRPGRRRQLGRDAGPAPRRVLPTRTRLRARALHPLARRHPLGRAPSRCRGHPVVGRRPAAPRATSTSCSSCRCPRSAVGDRGRPGRRRRRRAVRRRSRWPRPNLIRRTIFTDRTCTGSSARRSPGAVSSVAVIGVRTTASDSRSSLRCRAATGSPGPASRSSRLGSSRPCPRSSDRVGRPPPPIVPARPRERARSVPQGSRAARSSMRRAERAVPSRSAPRPDDPARSARTARRVLPARGATGPHRRPPEQRRRDRSRPRRRRREHTEHSGTRPTRRGAPCLQADRNPRSGGASRSAPHGIRRHARVARTDVLCETCPVPNSAGVRARRITALAVHNPSVQRSWVGPQAAEHDRVPRERLATAVSRLWGKRHATLDGHGRLRG